jgi:hypothetical protein
MTYNIYVLNGIVEKYKQKININPLMHSPLEE